MATLADLQAAIDAIRQTHPGWVLPPAPYPGVELLLTMPGNEAAGRVHAPNELFDWLRGQAPPGVFDASGQIANAPPGARPPDLPSPKAPEPPARIPGPSPGAGVNTALKKPRNHLGELGDSRTRKHKAVKSVPQDPKPTFLDGYKAFQDVDESGPEATGWDGRMNAVKQMLEDAVNSLGGGITGQFANALHTNLTQSYNVLRDMSQHAQMMEELVGAFFDDLATTKGNFAQNWETYSQAAKDPNDATNSETLRRLDDFAATIIQSCYRPPIDDISAGHPSIASALPSVGAPGPAPGGGPSGGARGGAGGGMPSGLIPGGLNTGIPEAPTEPASGQPQQSQTPSASTDAAKGAGDAAKQAGDQAQKAAGQGGDAAKKALSDALNAAQKGTAGLPEGVLNLGSKGSPGGARPGGGAGGRAGGGATDIKQPAKLAAPPKVAGAAAPASRAGVSGAGAGQGAAGTPAAGHRGGASDKAHKANKALRLTKNGEEVMGETEGVTPVIGAAPRSDAPADSKT
jgi:hypothetical protein